MSFTSVDLPEPDTPVTHVNVPSGILTGIPFKLCSRGLWIVSAWPWPLRRHPGNGLNQNPGRLTQGAPPPVDRSSSGLASPPQQPPPAPAPPPQPQQKHAWPTD